MLLHLFGVDQDGNKVPYNVNTIVNNFIDKERIKWGRGLNATIKFLEKKQSVNKTDEDFLELHNKSVELLKYISFEQRLTLLREGLSIWKMSKVPTLPKYQDKDERFADGTILTVRETNVLNGRRLPYNKNKPIEIKLTRFHNNGYLAEVLTEAAKEEMARKGVDNTKFHITHMELVSNFKQF